MSHRRIDWGSAYLRFESAVGCEDSPMTSLISVHEPVSAAVLDLPIAGVRLSGRTLREELQGSVCLLVFLRHFG